MHRIAGAPRPALGALARRKQVVRRNRDVADEPLGPKVDRNIAIERSPDALENDLTEALPLRLPERRPPTPLPVQPDSVAVRIPRPADRDGAGRTRQRAV